MNDLSLSNNNQLSMSSRDIAALVGSRHFDVFRSITRLIEKQVIGGYAATPYTQIQNGVQYQEYLINKRDSYVVVAQLSPEFTAKLVDRWQELEAANAPVIPSSLSEALRLAADQAEQIEKQQALIQHQKPAVEFVERYVEVRSSKSLREVAKVLGVKEREFIGRLIEDRIIFRQSGNLLPFATYQHSGYFTVKTGESNGHAFQQTRLTPKGISWISKRFGLIGDAA